MTGLTRTFVSPTLQDKAAVHNKPQQTPRRPHYGTRRRWSLRAAIPLWIGLAVAGWAAVIVSVYSFMRHENEVAVIEKIERPDRLLTRDRMTPQAPSIVREDADRLNTIAPASGTATPLPPAR